MHYDNDHYYMFIDIIIYIHCIIYTYHLYIHIKDIYYIVYIYIYIILYTYIYILYILYIYICIQYASMELNLLVVSHHTVQYSFH